MLIMAVAVNATPPGAECRSSANEQLGHDSTLIGWPWVEGTHSWIEPTAWAVLALKSVGTESAPTHARGDSLARRSSVARRRLQLRQHVRAGTATFASSAIERHLPVGAGRRKNRRPAHRPHLRISRARAESPNRHRIALLQLARAGCARPAVRHGRSAAGRRRRAEAGSRSHAQKLSLLALAARPPTIR